MKFWKEKKHCQSIALYSCIYSSTSPNSWASNVSTCSQINFICSSTCTRGICSLLSLDLIFSHHQVVRTGVTSHILSSASSFLQFLFLLSLSYFIPSPLHLIPFPPCPHCLPLGFISSSVSLSLACFPSDVFFLLQLLTHPYVLQQVS